MVVLKLPLIKFQYTLKNLFLKSHKSVLISLYKPNLKTFQPDLFMATLDSVLKFHSMKACVLMMLTSTIKLKNSLKLYDPKEILLFELNQIVNRMILESLGVEKYMDEHMNSTNYLLRLMKYKAPQSSETEMEMNVHTDRSNLTILYQNGNFKF
ncbi:hypothetical protein AABB24_031273 [Solanum stoloniferum]|uniref:Isopenicillin N synthase-like Fe(2+) 2OG dioxygenase domain-containing protein n=1 Tax=Solanum stoloniferum TaxID=62892 RepID=A0ABD2RUI2_9SOLN